MFTCGGVSAEGWERIMVAVYILSFIIIGFLCGVLSKRYMPPRYVGTHLGFSLAGIAGALAGGLTWYLILRSGQQFGTLGADPYAGEGYGTTEAPGYWTTPIAAVVGALFALACYKLIAYRTLER
jgi:uncharacterized membrane protein YeaQ/YmgE (transglycosylase-associated protein family)